MWELQVREYLSSLLFKNTLFNESFLFLAKLFDMWRLTFVLAAILDYVQGSLQLFSYDLLIPADYG